MRQFVLHVRHFLSAALFAGMAGLLCLTGDARAGEDESSVRADHIAVALVSESQATGDKARLEGALVIDIDDSWHAYWRFPGDGGLPPSFDWADSVNADGFVISWPVPQRFEVAGFYSFGYTGRVILPFAYDVVMPGAPVRLALDAAIMVCRDICVPQNVTLALDIPAGIYNETPAKQKIAAARADVPLADNIPALRIDNVVVGPDALVVNVFSQYGSDGMDLFVEASGADLYMTAPPDIIILNEDEPRYVMLRVAAPEGIDHLADALGGGALTLTLIHDGRAIEKIVDFSQ